MKELEGTRRESGDGFWVEEETRNLWVLEKVTERDRVSLEPWSGSLPSGGVRGRESRPQ